MNSRLYKILIVGLILVVSILTFEVGTQQRKMVSISKEFEKSNTELFQTRENLKKTYKEGQEHLVRIQEMSEELVVLSDRNVELTKKLKVANEKIDTYQLEVEKYRKKVTTNENSLQEYKKKLKDAEARKATMVASAEKPKTPTVDRGASSSSKSFTVNASAYTAYCNGCSGVTRTGVNLRSNPNMKLIAVDPRVIPLGSKVYVEGYGYAVAGDTGGAIKGNRIDLHMPTKAAAYQWGRKNVKITILN